MTNNLQNCKKIALLLILSRMSACLFARGFTNSKISVRHKNPKRFRRIPRMKPSVLEIEEKFPVGDIQTLESRLSELGFFQDENREMTDWYFDTSSYNLVRTDCWLRYRTAKCKGQWQLKIGRREHQGASTVYEEQEGPDAIQRACEIAASSTTTEESSAEVFSYSGHSVPEFPIPEAGFSPFARIHTRRATWKNLSKEFNSIVVDLDTTDFGYAVGEVETVVSQGSEIDRARRCIRSLITSLKEGRMGAEATLDATGKLEYYLEHNRPELFDLCLRTGVLRRQKADK